MELLRHFLLSDKLTTVVLTTFIWDFVVCPGARSDRHGESPGRRAGQVCQPVCRHPGLRAGRRRGQCSPQQDVTAERHCGNGRLTLQIPSSFSGCTYKLSIFYHQPLTIILMQARMTSKIQDLVDKSINFQLVLRQRGGAGRSSGVK